MSILSSSFRSLVFVLFPPSLSILWVTHHPDLYKIISALHLKGTRKYGLCSPCSRASCSVPPALVTFLLVSLHVVSFLIGFLSGITSFWVKTILSFQNYLFGKLVTWLCFWTKCCLGIVSTIGLPLIGNLTSLTSVFILQMSLSWWPPAGFIYILFYLGMFFSKNQS